jgi:hypothetical protein
MGFKYSTDGSAFERWEDEASGFAVERHNLHMKLEGDFSDLDRHGVEAVQRILDAAKAKLPNIQA